MHVNSSQRIENEVDSTHPMASSAPYLLERYLSLFGNVTDGTTGTYEQIQSNLQNQLNVVLSYIAPGKQYTLPLDLDQLLEENRLPPDNICKNGELAYKYYLREIVTQLNAFHEILEGGKQALQKWLANASDSTDFSLEATLSDLQNLEREAKAIIQKFSEYRVLKNIDITYIDHYDYNGEKWKPTAHCPWQVSADQVNDAYHQAETNVLDLTQPFSSRIPEVETLDDLRKIETEKFTILRRVTTSYYEKGTDQLTDRYNTNAETRLQVEEEILDQKQTEIGFFDELPLLDKLKYIVLYYTKPGTRYVFSGFPCLPNAEPQNVYTEDIKEISHLEPFFIGYLADRDGPINALASFMEIKSLAISEQVKVAMYRLKALKYYLALLNRGLQELNKSQSNEHARIPEVCYMILSSVGSNVIRTSRTLTINGKTEDYFVLQWTNDSGDANSHQTSNGCYLLVPETEEGINAFVEVIAHNACYKHIFNGSLSPLSGPLLALQALGYLSSEEVQSIRNAGYSDLDTCTITYQKGTVLTDNISFLAKEITATSIGKASIWRKDINDTPLYVMQENQLSQLPKEQEVVRINIATTGILDKWATTNLSWDHYDKDEDEKYKEAGAWDGLVTSWRTTYDTVLNNVGSQIEYIKKVIESLRQKINTFDSSASIFRNKAYTIYNKTVNNIE